MNLGDRFVRLVKSNLNSALSSLEDPEKVLEQAVNDMQRDLTKVRQAYAEVSASSKRAEEQMKLAEVWAARARMRVGCLCDAELSSRAFLCRVPPRRPEAFPAPNKRAPRPHCARVVRGGQVVLARAAGTGEG